MGLGFRCGDCPPGYSGDGLRCDDVNEVNCIYIFFLLLFLFIFLFVFFVLESLANIRYIKLQQSRSFKFRD